VLFSPGRRLALLAKPQFVVGAIVLAVAAVAAYYSHQIVGYEPDEVGYTRLAIGIAHSLTPVTLAHGGSQRLNQLYPLLIAPIWGSFGNVTAFRISHLWNALLLASAAIPAYLLAREVVQRRWAAYAAAALVAVAPWITLSTAELTEVAAYPACAWALLAMMRSLAEPSPRRDIVALAAIAFASFGRLQLILLFPVLVLAVLMHELGYALTRSEERRTALRLAIVRICSRHTPLAVVGVAGIVVGVPLLLSGVLAKLFGFYGNTLSGATFNGETFALARDYIAFMAIGLAAVPVAITFGFIGESLVSPPSRRLHAFASLAFLTIAAITLQVAELSVRYEEGVLQERYFFYIVPLFAVGMCAGLLSSRRRMPVLLGGAAVLALLVASTTYQSARTAFWYQVSPAMAGYYDWIAPRFGAAAGPTANPGAARLVLAGAAILAAGLVLAALTRRVARERLFAAVAALAIIFCCVESVHALSRVVHGNSSGKGFDSGNLRNADWVDRAAPSSASVAQVDANVDGADNSRLLWTRSAFWNRSIGGSYTFEGTLDPYFATSRLRVDGSGAVALEGGRAGAAGETPPYLVTVARGFPVAVAGTTLASSPDGALELVRTASPLRARWAVSGVSSDGWLAIEHPAIVRLYMLSGAVRRCANVSVTLALSSLTTSPRKLLLSVASAAKNLTILPGETQTATTRVCGDARAVPAISLSSVQGAPVSNEQLTPQLKRVAVATS
jgi:hypothetical protein